MTDIDNATIAKIQNLYKQLQEHKNKDSVRETEEQPHNINDNRSSSSDFDDNYNGDEFSSPPYSI